MNCRMTEPYDMMIAYYMNNMNDIILYDISCIISSYNTQHFSKNKSQFLRVGQTIKVFGAFLGQTHTILIWSLLFWQPIYDRTALNVIQTKLGIVCLDFRITDYEISYYMYIITLFFIYAFKYAYEFTLRAMNPMNPNYIVSPVLNYGMASNFNILSTYRTNDP